MLYAVVGSFSSERDALFAMNTPLSVGLYGVMWLLLAAFLIWGRNILHFALGTAEETEADLTFSVVKQTLGRRWEVLSGSAHSLLLAQALPAVAPYHRWVNHTPVEVGRGRWTRRGKG